MTPGPQYSKAIAEAPVLLFAGAGASAHLSRPVMAELYQELDARLGRDEDTERVWRELSAGPPAGNVEHILEMAELACALHRALGERRRLEEMLRKREPIRWTTWQAAERIASEIKQEILKAYGDVAVDEELRRCYLPFLESVLGVTQHPVLPVFTTNYDLVLDSVEASGDELGVRWETGFEEPHIRGQPGVWRGARLDELVVDRDPPWVVLLKLHGSVSWQGRPDGDVVVTFGPDGAPIRATEGKALIWPALTKVARDEPFRSAYEYLARCLDKARLAVFIGYGFQDVGVMERLRAAVRHNRDLRVVVVDPEEKGDAFARWGVPWEEVAHIELAFDAAHVDEISEQFAEHAALAEARARVVPDGRVRTEGEPLTWRELQGWEKVGDDWEVEHVDEHAVRLVGRSAGWKQLVSTELPEDFEVYVDVLGESRGGWAALFLRRTGAHNCYALMVEDDQVRVKLIWGHGPDDRRLLYTFTPTAPLIGAWVRFCVRVRGEKARIQAWDAAGTPFGTGEVIDPLGFGGRMALACREGDHSARFRNICVEPL